MGFKEYDVINRRQAFSNFIGYTDPIFSITSRLDVTSMFSWCKKHHRSFFIEFMYAVSCAANDIENFRVRIEDDRPIIFDRVDPSYIVIRADNSICTCQSEFTRDRERFFTEVRKTIDSAKTSEDEGVFNNHRDKGLLYISCVPWVDVVSLKNPYNLEDKGSCSIPRITWAKVVEEGMSYKVTVDVSAHHALMDGYHVSQFLSVLQKIADDYRKEGD